MNPAPRSVRTRARSPWAVVAVLWFALVPVLTTITSTLVAVGVALEDLPVEDRPHLPLTLALHGAVLVLSASLYVGGRLGDRYGPRGVHVLGLATFAASCTAFGLAPHSAVMAVAAVGQGVGGALVLSQTFTTVAAVLPAGQRASAAWWFAALVGLSAVAVPFGPTLLMGLASDVVGSRHEWRIIFLLPALVAGVTAVFGAALLPDTGPVSRHRPGWAAFLPALVGFPLYAVRPEFLDAPSTGGHGGYWMVENVLGGVVAVLVALMVGQHLDRVAVAVPYLPSGRDARPVGRPAATALVAGLLVVTTVMVAALREPFLDGPQAGLVLGLLAGMTPLAAVNRRDGRPDHLDEPLTGPVAGTPTGAVPTPNG